MFGEPVRRGPMSSVSVSAISITFELRNPSSRMRVCIVRSGVSAAKREKERRKRSAVSFFIFVKFILSEASDLGFHRADESHLRGMRNRY